MQIEVAVSTHDKEYNSVVDGEVEGKKCLQHKLVLSWQTLVTWFSLFY